MENNRTVYYYNVVAIERKNGCPIHKMSIYVRLPEIDFRNSQCQYIYTRPRLDQ